MLPYTPPTDPYLDIIYQDEHILIADKQSGILTVPGRGPEKKDCLISRIQETFPTAEVVHRLDMETSGLVIFALSKSVQSDLGRQFQDRNVSKTYHAIVAGCPETANGCISLPLIADWPNRPRQKVDFEIGKPSETLWECIDRAETRSLFRLTPITGRSHQLRVHMAEIGHPILGDRLYAPEGIFKERSRLQLHASHIQLSHPVSGDDISCISPLPFSL